MSDKAGKESQYIVSRPETSSDPPIGLDRVSGCDNVIPYVWLTHIHIETPYGLKNSVFVLEKTYKALKERQQIFQKKRVKEKEKKKKATI